MSVEPKPVPPVPPVALVTLWAMAASRSADPPSSDLVRLLCVVAERMNREGICKTGADTLARDCGWSRNRVNRWIDKASNLGLIEVGRGGGRKHPNTIRFLGPIIAAPTLTRLAELDADRRKLLHLRDAVSVEKLGPKLLHPGAETAPSEAGNCVISASKLLHLDDARTSCSSSSSSSSAPSVESLNQQTTDNGHGNGARTEVVGERPSTDVPPGVYVPPERKPDAPPRVEQIRQSIAGPGRFAYVPKSEDEWNQLKARLDEQAAEQAAVLRGAS